MSSFYVLTGAFLRRIAPRGGRGMRFVMGWLASVLALVIGLGDVTAATAAAAGPPIVRDLEAEALEEAVRWPKADVSAIMTLAGRLMAARRDAEGLAYFRERAASEPDRGLFLALEGVFQAR